MDAAQIIQLLVGTPLSAVLLYLLIAEQRAHTQTRATRDADNREWMSKFSAQAAMSAQIAQQSAVAMERMSDALERIDVLTRPARS